MDKPSQLVAFGQIIGRFFTTKAVLERSGDWKCSPAFDQAERLPLDLMIGCWCLPAAQVDFAGDGGGD